MKLFFCQFLLLCSFVVCAQQKPTELDKSPLDVSYCPPNYPIQKMNGKITMQPIARVLYSRPQKAGRDLFGNLIVYNQIWRLGANEATEIEFFKDVKIGDKKVSKGRYTLYAICSENTWSIIINSEKDVWGLSYNAKKDMARIDVPVQQTESITEYFTIYFDNTSSSGNLNIMWDKLKVAMPFTF